MVRKRGKKMNDIKHRLIISGKHHKKLMDHLYPGDGNEAVAVAICGRHNYKNNKKLLVNELILIPYDQCPVRTPDLVNWSTTMVIPFLEKASRKGMALLKIHSHPGGYRDFSETDDKSDRELFESVYGWMEDEEPHASAIMLPDGEIFGRIMHSDLSDQPIDRITICGDDIILWDKNHANCKIQEFEKRTSQAFGAGTTSILKSLKITIVGCSGTGSPVIEQLVRLGVGQVVLVDPDRIEEKNLNRIINSTIKDAKTESFKVQVLKKAIENIGLGTHVIDFNKNLFDDNAIINEIASSDVIFGCVDSVDGRHLLNQIATFYLIPYFDLGVKLKSDGKGGIDQIMGSVHYLQPGGSSLRMRGVYSEEELRASSMFRSNPNEYHKQKRSGYIVDVAVDSPAVVSINTQIASIAVNEFLARIHPFRYDSNENFAINRISFTDSYVQHEKDGESDPYLSKFVGRGHMTPILNMPELN